jgi:hypothetical protein
VNVHDGHAFDPFGYGCKLLMEEMRNKATLLHSAHKVRREGGA